MFGRSRRVAGALGAAAVLVISLSTAPAGAGPIESPNLLVNPGAEFGDPSLTGYSAVSIPGWTVTGTPTVVKYGTVARSPSPLSKPGPQFPGPLQFPRAAVVLLTGSPMHWGAAATARRRHIW